MKSIPHNRSRPQPAKSPGRICAPVSLMAALLLMLGAMATTAGDAPVAAELQNLSINGGIQDGKASLVIEALLKGLSQDDERLIYATTIEQNVQVSADRVGHQFRVTLDIVQGQPREIPLKVTGPGEIRSVEGAHLLDWSIRWGTNNTRYLVLRFPKTDQRITRFEGMITGESEVTHIPASTPLLTLTPEDPALFGGYLTVTSDDGVNVELQKPRGLARMNQDFLPEQLLKSLKSSREEVQAYRFHGGQYEGLLWIRYSDPDPEKRQIVLRNFQLTGDLGNESATFTLTAEACVDNAEGGELPLLSGDIALTTFERSPGWNLRLEKGRYILSCQKPGTFPIRLTFQAAVSRSGEWNALHFQVAPSTLQPLTLRGLPADTEFNFEGASKPERNGAEFVSFLPASGAVKFSWQSTREEAEGRLFYAAEMLSQITISAGLMSQSSLLDFKVMQGEMSEVILRLRGEGEVTRVQGDSVLSWKVDRVAGSPDRRLSVQLNAQQKSQFALAVQTQTPLGAFPVAADALLIQPENATRFAGYHRIVNEGAVRLEVVDASGLSQIGPEQFPESNQTKAVLRVTGTQRFVYRFSGPDFALRIQADNILPELGVSEILAYHLGETESTIDADIELDIREAPVRELLLRIPKGYVIARLNASGISDYFQREGKGDDASELRMVYGQPVSGRQLISLRLERNESFSRPDSESTSRVGAPR